MDFYVQANVSFTKDICFNPLKRSRTGERENLIDRQQTKTTNT
jgi:hypothetical protein